MGHTVRCEIWREASKAPASVGELTFPYESPLTIEWDADSKRETIQGSTATLTVESPGDRTYIGLYTTVAGSVQLRVYRDNALWWSGTLDPEHYEEPFSMQKNYDVTFTFTDFGILDRLKYELTGVQSIHAVMLDALTRARNYQTSYARYMSTNIGNSTTALNNFCIDSDNFTDEDGETQTMRDVLEGVLQPLDLHLRQWNGVMTIFDSHTAAQSTPQAVTWEDTDQTLSVDEVYNNVKVTFSPYATDKIIRDSIYSSKLNIDTSLQNITTTTKTATADGMTYAYHQWYVNNLTDNQRGGQWDYDFIGFTLYVLQSETTATDRGISYSGLIPVHFESFGNGTTCDALLRYCRKNTHVNASNAGSYGTRWAYKQYPQSFTPIMTMPRVSIPKKPTKGTYYLRLVMPLMLSAAYNPFTTECQGEADNVEKLTYRAGYVMVPVRLRLYNASGAVVYHYENDDVSIDVNPTVGYTQGKWVSGDYSNSVGSAKSNAWLSYYAISDRKTTNGIDGGWADNRQFCNLSKKESFESFKSLDAGQYCDMPPVSGLLQVEVLDGVYIYDWGSRGTTDTTLLGATVSTTQALYNTITWHAYQPPHLDLVRYMSGKTFAVEADDIEYAGTLDVDAKDELSIDTICGTASAPIPGARGMMMDTSGNQLTSLTRAGRTDTAEQLLIGTIHSHYATRHAKLSGTMRLASTLPTLPVFSDATLDMPMIATSVVADIRADEMEATLIETNADCYVSV